MAALNTQEFDERMVNVCDEDVRKIMLIVNTVHFKLDEIVCLWTCIMVL